MLRYCQIPLFNEWVGLDLQKGEWLSPHGYGVFPDVMLRFSSSRNGIHHFQFSMEVSFTNNPFAGAYLMKKDMASQFQTVYKADSNALYRASFVFCSRQLPGERKQRDILEADSYLVFRTRTKIDDEGNLVSAHYGVITGRWLSESETMILSGGYFNPIPNDTNLEDMKTAEKARLAYRSSKGFFMGEE